MVNLKERECPIITCEEVPLYLLSVYLACISVQLCVKSVQRYLMEVAQNGKEKEC